MRKEKKLTRSKSKIMMTRKQKKKKIKQTNKNPKTNIK